MNATPNPKTMLLIDGDNVSVDVIEQAVALMLAEHGALHVRRAYGTAESAAKHQATFRRLGIRPMVNLATGKNSTDIALAVDALDLVLAERPAVVAIVSSDSDFAPLVARLREKGCRVVGIGQAGKTGDETRTVYDAFTVLEHRKGGAGARAATRSVAADAPAAAPTKRGARKAATPAPTAAAPEPAPVPPARARRGRNTPAAETAAAPAASTRPTAARRRAGRVAAPGPAPEPSADSSLAERVQRILQSMPELARGETVELRVAAERLRDAGLLSRSGSSTRVFGAHPERFELLPSTQPNKVRLKAG